MTKTPKKTKPAPKAKAKATAKAKPAKTATLPAKPTTANLPVPTTTCDGPEGAITLTWESGDYEEANGRTRLPGMKITATLAPGDEDGTYQGPALVLIDNALDSGEEVTLNQPLLPSDGWIIIPEFVTHEGVVSITGELRVAHTTSGYFLQARLTYGAEIRRHVVGFLMAFDGVRRMV